MTLRDKLLEIRNELKPVKDVEKIFDDGLEMKLGRSEDNYQKAIKKNCEYILSRSNYKAIMAIDRYNRYKERHKDEQKDNYGFIETI